MRDSATAVSEKDSSGFASGAWKAMSRGHLPIGALVSYPEALSRATLRVTTYLASNQVVSARDYLNAPFHSEAYGARVRKGLVDASFLSPPMGRCEEEPRADPETGALAGSCLMLVS